MDKQTKIAIIGAGGVFGEALYNLMINDSEYKISIFTSQLTYEMVYLEREVYSKSPLDYKEFKKDILAVEPDVIVNAVGLNDPAIRESDRKHSWELNAVAAENIAKAARLTGSRLVMISSDRVFNGRKGPYVETDRPDPVTYFGKAKLAAENIAISTVQDTAIVRVSGIFGNSGFGKNDIISTLIDKFEAEEKVILSDNDRFNPIHSIDLAAIVANIIKRKNSGIWHAGTREIISQLEFARKVAEVYELSYEDQFAPAETNEKKPEKYGLVTLKTETDLAFPTPGLMNSLIAHKSLSDGWKPIKLIY